ncbi:murein hydrolase activator EnvC family protein [Legionella septentrionalis]|nr:peptidoglycan DD-metalloendopeptidase family protein [Legionella septentrionalis]
MRMRTKLFCVCLFLKVSSLSFAESAPIHETRNKLKDLDIKISKLQQTLAHAHNKQAVLYQELAATDKKIGESVKKLHETQEILTERQNKIADLQQQIASVNKRLQKEQHLLAIHVRTRYKMGEYQPLKWFINQEDPATINRLLTYYEYLIRSQKNMVAQVKKTKETLTSLTATLHSELLAQQKLQEQIVLNQQKLKNEKSYQIQLAHTMGKDILSARQTLKEYQQNKANLARLLQTLMQQSLLQTQSPFSRMRHKLPLPVKIARDTLQKLNHGLIFYAKEGTAINAVYPGKVVFSDWLKGYGLLLIIDHGQGFMTLYAHNQSLYKQKGDVVHQHEQIATVGHSGGLNQNGLYFEIRHRGKVISPLEWLS